MSTRTTRPRPGRLDPADTLAALRYAEQDRSTASRIESTEDECAAMAAGYDAEVRAWEALDMSTVPDDGPSWSLLCDAKASARRLAMDRSALYVRLATNYGRRRYEDECRALEQATGQVCGYGTVIR